MSVSTISSTIGEYAKKRRLSEKAFLEIGAATLSTGTNTVNFAEPWNVAPTVYIEVKPGSVSTGSVQSVSTTGFVVFSSGAGTVKWAALRFSDRTT